jgi:hypothetical protein
MFTVCSVLYGNYPELASRLLNSLEPHAHIVDVRLGLNAVSNATKDLAYEWAQDFGKPVSIYNPDRNVGKYPLMRAMLRDPGFLLAPRIMWFDDDSHLDVAPGWWDRVAAMSVACTQLGMVHVIRPRGRQREMIIRQPWYAGLPLQHNHLFRFVTGGWWTADSAFLLSWDYPFPDIHHNGGDSILGELIRQRSKALLSFSDGARCHCEACVRKPAPVFKHGCVHINVGGRKGRRGIGCTGEKYVWADGQASDLSHQLFSLVIDRVV